MITENLANSPAIETLGWTLLHSVWQIALVGGWLFLTLRASVKSSANSRYLVSLFALLLALILPVTTFFWLSQNSSAANRNPVTFNAENAVMSSEKLQPQESLSAPEIIKDDNATSDGFFVSVEDLQNDFVENFSALAPFLVGLWFLGLVFSAVRLFAGVWQLRVYKTRGTFAPSEDWQRKFEGLCERLKIKQTVKLVSSKIVETPMVIGWLKPLVLVPASVFTGMNWRELETILAHELIHIRRYDYLVNFAQSFVEILFFYHPAARWISAQIRRERECACDDQVVKFLENSNIVYANALANLEEFRQTAKQTASPVLVTANGGKLMKRIERIVGKNKNAEIGKFQTSLWSASLVFALISALLFGLFSCIESPNVNAQTKSADGKAKKLAVGFVSIPLFDRVKNSSNNADSTMNLLIEKLKARRVPAIGFVNGGSVSLEQNLQERIDAMVASINETSNSLSEKPLSNPAEIARMQSVIEKLREQRSMLEKMSANRADVVRMWRDAGLEVGIGGYKHIWFHNTPVAEYIANAEKNETITKDILADKNTPLRYFSYPYLNTGKTVEDKNQFENWLASRNLRSVKYTFDNQEWMYSFAYDQARNDNDGNRMNEIRAEYLEYMTKMIVHYEAYSQEMFGRDIAQTLVLTPSRLVADTADAFFGTLEKRGYQFVSMDEAQSDEAYQTKETHVETQSGISWFERWQMAKGKKLRDEPPVSQSIQRTWENRGKNPPPPPAPPAPPSKKFL